MHTAKGAGAGADGGLIVARGDSAFYSQAVVAAARRAGACFSITARQNRSVQAAIATIDDNAWTPIQYPNAIWEETEQRWISDAEVAEIDFTAFTSRAKAEHVTARLIVRRVTRLQPSSEASRQGVLFDTYRYHAVFTNTDHHAASGVSAPRARHHRRGPRRPTGRGPSPPTVGAVRGQRRLVAVRGHGVQPHPHRRRHGQPPTTPDRK